MAVPRYTTLFACVLLLAAFSGAAASEDKPAHVVSLGASFDDQVNDGNVWFIKVGPRDLQGARAAAGALWGRIWDVVARSATDFCCCCPFACFLPCSSSLPGAVSACALSVSVVHGSGPGRAQDVARQQCASDQQQLVPRTTLASGQPFQTFLPRLLCSPPLSPVPMHAQATASAWPPPGPSWVRQSRTTPPSRSLTSTAPSTGTSAPRLR
jgi:hypothetical protein